MATLEEFVTAKPRISTCAVCSLPPELLAQVERNEKKNSRTGRVSRRVVAEWLQRDCGTSITAAMLNNHVSRGHSA